MTTPSTCATCGMEFFDETQPVFHQCTGKAAPSGAVSETTLADRLLKLAESVEDEDLYSALISEAAVARVLQQRRPNEEMREALREGARAIIDEVHRLAAQPARQQKLIACAATLEAMAGKT